MFWFIQHGTTQRPLKWGNSCFCNLPLHFLFFGTTQLHLTSHSLIHCLYFYYLLTPPFHAFPSLFPLFHFSIFTSITYFTLFIKFYYLDLDLLNILSMTCQCRSFIYVSINFLYHIDRYKEPWTWTLTNIYFLFHFQI